MYKHILITLACISMPLLVFSQRYPTGKGTIRTGGGMSFTQSKEENNIIYRLGITPKLGYFVLDNVLVNLDMNYLIIADDYSVTSSIKLSPGGRYYLQTGSSVFIIADAIYNLDRSTTFVSGTKIIEDHSSVSIGPGVDYFFTRRIGFEVELLYTAYLNPDEDHMGKLGLNFGFNIHLPTKREKPYTPKSNKKAVDDDF